MKKLNFFVKTFGMFVFATCFCSCLKINVPEITEDTVISFEKPSSQKFLGISMSHCDAYDEVEVDFRGDGDKTITFPKGGFYTFYEDSLVVITANKHKITVLYHEIK